MRLIKIFFFLFLLSSCNKYLGTVEPDYSPSKEVTEIFSSNVNYIDLKEDIIFGTTKYPYSKSFNKNVNFLKMQKIANINENTKVYSNNDNIFFTKKNLLIKINKSDKKNKTEYKIVLNKDLKNYEQIFSENSELVENFFLKAVNRYSNEIN